MYFFESFEDLLSNFVALPTGRTGPQRIDPGALGDVGGEHPDELYLPLVGGLLDDFHGAEIPHVVPAHHPIAQRGRLLTAQHLDIASRHIGQFINPPSTRYQLRGHSTADEPTEVGCYFVHAGLDVHKQEGVVLVQDEDGLAARKDLGCRSWRELGVRRRQGDGE